MLSLEAHTSATVLARAPADSSTRRTATPARPEASIHPEPSNGVAERAVTLLLGIGYADHSIRAAARPVLVIVRVLPVADTKVHTQPSA